MLPYSLSAQTTTTDQKGWHALFDGSTLNGWKAVGGKAPYTVEDGAIVGRMTKKDPQLILDYRSRIWRFYTRVGCKA